MTKKEKYGLNFTVVNHAGKKVFRCTKDQVDSYSQLQIIHHLEVIEVKALMDDLNNALKSQYYEQYFCSDSVECDDIELVYPNITINGLTIAMQDMLDLLNEWLIFISK